MSLLDDYLLEKNTLDPSEFHQMRRTWLLRVLTELTILNALMVEMQRHIDEIGVDEK